jgi:hypothetical protein
MNKEVGNKPRSLISGNTLFESSLQCVEQFGANRTKNFEKTHAVIGSRSIFPTASQDKRLPVKQRQERIRGERRMANIQRVHLFLNHKNLSC